MGGVEKMIKAGKENTKNLVDTLKDNSSNSDDIQAKILMWSRITAIVITLTLIMGLFPYVIKLAKWTFSFL